MGRGEGRTLVIGRRSLLAGMASASLVPACGSGLPPVGAPRAPRDPVARLRRSLHYVAKDRALAALPSRPSHCAIYDAALVALVLLRRGHREEAGHLLAGLAAAQLGDGSIPFVVSTRGEPSAPYVRSGALAWVGYAGVAYLDADRAGPHREIVTRMIHRLAAALEERTVHLAQDPRDDLVTGGRGVFRHELERGRITREIFEDGERDWVSTEHAVDAYFFLRDLGRLSAGAGYASAAERIGAALVARAWDEERGQLVRGITREGPDRLAALDCATWGGVLLLARGERLRAERSLTTADERHASGSGRIAGARGHKPYADGPVIESWALRQQVLGEGVAGSWADFQTVWPEGSAGVALLAARLGRRDRAREILAGLEVLRDESGALPTATDPVPQELDTAPSLAATAWVELVRLELDGGPGLWPA